MPKNQVHSKDNSNSDVLSKSSSSANDIFDEKSKEKTDIISSNVSNDEKDRNNSNLFDNNTAGKIGIISSNVSNDEKDRNNSNLFDNNTAGKTDITSSNVSDDEKDRNNSNLFDNNTTGKIDIISSNISNDEKDRNNSNLFDNITAGPPLSKKPVIASKPIIKQKPKVPSTPKPSLFKNSPEESDVFSSDKKPPQTSKTVKEQEKIEDSVSSKNEIATKPDENNLSIPQLEERVCAKDPSPPQPPTKPEPPKTLNIRKTTGLLFSSSSNEDEDLFGLSFPGKSSLNSSSVEADENAPPILESLNDEKPKTFSTEKRSRSDKEISSKLESSQEQNGSSIIKARSVGASPKQLNIDPMALLPGAKPPPRGQHNAEVAVGFDRPAQLTATLHSAGKVSCYY
ncbi:hypothetical protein C0J52_10280 [Blattella germanica]|nr:hypothetical protein C0J52_10280 [Blattella germanica]